MKFSKITLVLFLLVLTTGVLRSQNMIVTLGTGGLFTIKDASNNYLTLSQSTGQVNILRSLRLAPTGNSSTTGVIFKGANRFIHDFKPSGANGYNTFIGLNSGNFSMSGTGTNSSYNTGVGSYSLISLTTGYQNTALGSRTLYYNTTGYRNTAVGYQSLHRNTAGYYNTAVGYSSLFYNTTGDYNTAIGYQSLLNNTTANYNTAVGYYSLYSNTSGYQNTAVGYESLTQVYHTP